MYRIRTVVWFSLCNILGNILCRLVFGCNIRPPASSIGVLWAFGLMNLLYCVSSDEENVSLSVSSLSSKLFQIKSKV